jgi:glutamate-1-semialdehyde 2,1-aminomutase
MEPMTSGSGSAVATPIDRGRIAALTERELRTVNARTPGSREMFERARRTLASGVASSYQLRDPWPIYLERGEGAMVWDVDGNELFDFHNGFGSMVQGHANPAIGRAIADRYRKGTHFAAPTEDGIVVAEELARRFRLPRWRYTNSGSESTMDAIRIARGLTGRDDVLKIMGSYHGHHDAVMVSIGGEADEVGPREAPLPLPYGAGIPAATVDLTRAVPFNDAAAMEARIVALAGEGRKPACVIMEAAMMNLGVILPEPGYLEAVRELTARHDVVLIFDEVKTGLTMAAGGAVERFGVVPDMVTLAKGLGGGLPTGAIGMSEEVAAVVEDGSVYQVGTFNGNPLGMAAARASLFEVLTPDTYAHIDRLNERILAGCDEVIAEFDLPGYTVGLGAKGCVTFSPVKVTDYLTFKDNADEELAELAWLHNFNRGIYMTPGREEEWTLSVAHDETAVDAYVGAFRELAADLRRSTI